jgi:arylsulfatase A-like enzyme
MGNRVNLKVLDTAGRGPMSYSLKRLPALGLILGLAGLAAVLLAGSCSREPERPNVVLIVVDALRPDHLGCYGYERPTSPVIDGLAQDGVFFETAVTAAPWTKTSFSSFLTSLYPFQHGVGGWEQIMPDSVVTLPEVLRGHGYSTMAVINMLGITGRFEVLKGVDDVSAAAKYKRDAEKATTDAIELIRRGSPPFFIIIHYFDVHWPYRPPIRYVDMIRAEGDVDPIAAGGRVQRGVADRPAQAVIDREILMYDACIRFTDNEIGRLLGFLDASDMRDETLVIVTADHGEAFWEHGAGSHGRSVYDEEIRVPLIFNSPELYRKPQRVGQQVSLMDLVPTIMGITGASDDHHREGRDLTPLIRKGILEAAPERLLPTDLDLAESTLQKAPDTKGIRSRDWKLILEPATALFQLYDQRHDPGETDNLWGRAGAIGDSLASLMQMIPGSSVNGWRLGFTGTSAVTDRLRIDVEMEHGHRLTSAQRLVAGGDEEFGVADDSTSFHIEIRPQQQQIVLFDTEPAPARVKFTVRGAGEEVGDVVYTGRRQVASMDERFTLDTDQALGTPETFETNRSKGVPGVYIWWLPGEAGTKVRRRTDLTPEEIKRLKALGYIQ